MSIVAETNNGPTTILGYPFRDRFGRCWQPVLNVRVYGDPKGQPRVRAATRKFGATIRAVVYDAGTANDWKSMVALAFNRLLPAMPLSGPIRMDAVYLFDRPKRLLKKKSATGRIEHEAKPDRDNLDKAAMDTLTTIRVWGDDAQVCSGEVDKFYRAINERPGAEIRISRMIEGSVI